MYVRHRGDQWTDWQNSNFYKEPYWLNWPESECGRAWEQTLFGGTIEPINSRVDGSHGIAITDWPFHGTAKDPQKRTWHTISMRYIERLFQISTWQRNFDLSQWRTFHVPRDGATSLYLCSFTTMPISEEQRAANEELAELLALENDQPAKKKRVVGTGRKKEKRLAGEEFIQQAVVDQEELEQDLGKAPTIPISRPTSLEKSRLIDRPTRPTRIRQCQSKSSGQHDDEITTQDHEDPQPQSTSTGRDILADEVCISPKPLTSEGLLDATLYGSPLPVAAKVSKKPTLKTLTRSKRKPAVLSNRHRESGRRGISRAKAVMARKRGGKAQRTVRGTKSALIKTMVGGARQVGALAAKKQAESRQRDRRKKRLLV